jgi:hypothetical protein
MLVWCHRVGSRPFIVSRRYAFHIEMDILILIAICAADTFLRAAYGECISDV